MAGKVVVLESQVAPPVRIALCITELERGGAERCLVELARRLDRRQFQPVVYCLGPRPAGNPSSLADALERSGVELVCFDARGVFDAPRVYWHLRRQMLRDRPALVQCFLFHANVLGAAAARAAGVPHVLSGIRVAEHEKSWHRRLARWADRWTDWHVCVSQSVVEFSAVRTGLDPTKLITIPNGVDVGRFESACPIALESLGVAAGRSALVLVGRIEAQKNLDLLLRMMPDVFQRLPQHDLVVVGEGSQRRALEALARSMGLDGRVKFVGAQHDVPEILAAADLLVLPSLWEGMPNVVLEAMAAAKPVVATNVEGVAEVLGHLAPEQLVAGPRPEVRPDGELSRSAQLFADRIVAIASDRELATRLGEENRQRVRAHFSLDAMAEAYGVLFRSLLQASPGRAKK